MKPFDNAKVGDLVYLPNDPKGYPIIKTTNEFFEVEIVPENFFTLKCDFSGKPYPSDWVGIIVYPHPVKTIDGRCPSNCGKESEPILSLDWGQSYVYCPKCKLSGPNKISKKEATDSWNQVSRSVRESMWTKFDPKDESTYPPNEETQIELTLNDGSLYLDEWVYFDTEDGIGWGFETDICYHRIKAWRIPIPYKEQE